LSIVESFDTRQQSKVLHKLSEIIGISLFAMIANANEPEEIEISCKAQESLLHEYFVLANRDRKISAARFLRRFREAKIMRHTLS